jgi:SSS family solute:Na+ symporter
MGAVTLIYTSLGGLQAVVWTDVLQTFILLFGAIASLVVISVKLHGVGAWWPTHWAPQWEKFQFFPDGSPHLSFLDMNMSTFIWYVCTSGSDQMAVQRYLATRDARGARRAYNINMLMDVIVLFFSATLGFALLGYFRAFPQMVPPGVSIEKNADQLFPHFIVFGLPTGATGLVVAGLLAAAMSSLSSGMSSVTSVITVDFLDRFNRQKVSQRQNLRRTKIISLIVGVVTVLLSFIYVSRVAGNLLEVANKVVNLLTAPLFILFLMALFVPFATGAGAIAGSAVGALVAATVAYWPQFTGRPGLGFTWIMPASLVSGVIVALLASLIFGRPKPLEADLEYSVSGSGAAADAW